MLPGDFVGAGLGLNNKGEVVGPSFPAPGPSGASPRAFLWANGKMHDLNALVPPLSPLYMLLAYAINDFGEIAGFGVETSSGDVHAFLATPCDRNPSNTDWCGNGQGSASEEAESTIERPTVVVSPTSHELVRHLLRFGRTASVQ